MKINIEVTGKEAIMTVKVGRDTFVEKRKPVNFNETKDDGTPSIIEQMRGSGLNDDFIDDFENAIDDFMLHDLLCLVYEWD